MRWVASGVLLGSLAAGLGFAPASWLASALSAASGQRLLLADARGTVWQGSAVMVLTGGEGSHDASALPGRLRKAGRRVLRTNTTNVAETIDSTSQPV